MSQLMAMPAHPQVAGIEEVLEDEAELHVVMPLCVGGDLWSLTEEGGPVLMESDCKGIIRQVLLGLDHLHRNNIIHQDVKLDNIMLDSAPKQVVFDPKNGRFAVKIIDFDLCEGWFPGRPKEQGFAGTPGFIAPEVLLGGASPQSDLWSVGVVLYVLLTGADPYPEVTDKLCELLEEEHGLAGSVGAKRLYSMMRVKRVDWNAAPWRDFHLACDLCQKLLEFDPQRRPWSAQQVLRHRWLDFETEDRPLPRCLAGRRP